MRDWIECSKELPPYDIPVWVCSDEGSAILIARILPKDGGRAWARWEGAPHISRNWLVLETKKSDEFYPTHWTWLVPTLPQHQKEPTWKPLPACLLEEQDDTHD